MAKKKFSEEDVIVLVGLDKIRMNASMYIGPTDDYGLGTLAKEVIDNIVDEYEQDRCTLGQVFINTKTQRVTVYDDGQGMPVGKKKGFKESTLQLLTSEIHAGGKFEGDAYTNTRGTHGVGIKATNAMSESFVVFTFRDKAWHKIEYASGKLLSGVEKVTAKEVEKHFAKIEPNLKVGSKGTIISYQPQLSLFSKGSKISIDWLNSYLTLNSYFSPELQFNLTVDNKKTVEYYSEEGITEYLDNRKKELKAESITSDEPLEIYTDAIELAIDFTDCEGNKLEAYTNGLYNSEGGTHYNEFCFVYAQTLMKHVKKSETVYPSDLTDGLLGVLNYKVDAPNFDGQTKEKLADVRFEEHSEELANELTKYWKKNKNVARTIIERAVNIRNAKKDFMNARKVAGKLKRKRGERELLPGKLSEAKACSDMERELFLVEGDSAGGTAKSARMNNPRYQEVLPLRGKILNAVKTSQSKNPDKIWDSEEVVAILKAIGYNPDKDNPIEHLRIGKLILLSDADVDGLHINSLELGLIATYLPEMIDKGMVYVVKSPKYYVNDKGNHCFGQSLEDIAKQTKASPSYLKGWGELNALPMRKIAFDPSHRELIQITPTQGKLAANFVKLMGEDTKYRKEMLGV